MARVETSLVLYAVDLQELRAWVGCGDAARFQEAWDVLRSDEDAEWEPQELEVLERLLRRLIFEGKLYEKLSADERYYLTQLLIDLFDEYVDQEALSEDMPFDKVVRAVEELPKGSEAARISRWLVRGRELGGDGVLWETGPVEDLLALFGYVTREEAPRLAESLSDAMRKAGGRPRGLLKQIQSAAEESGRAELDLVGFVG
jgi:hypothetical protein